MSSVGKPACVPAIMAASAASVPFEAVLFVGGGCGGEVGGGFTEKTGLLAMSGALEGKNYQEDLSSLL